MLVQLPAEEEKLKLFLSNNEVAHNIEITSCRCCSILKFPTQSLAVGSQRTAG